jgi:hypothetical protein
MRPMFTTFWTFAPDCATLRQRAEVGYLNVRRAVIELLFRMGGVGDIDTGIIDKKIFIYALCSFLSHNFVVK